MVYKNHIKFVTHIFYLYLLLFSWADAATNLSHVSGGFDQETAAGVMARLAVQK